MKTQSLFFYLFSVPALLAIWLLSVASCSEAEDEVKETRRTVPFRSVAVEAVGERAEAVVTDEKNLSLAYEKADDFSCCRLHVDLLDGYELLFPTDPDSFDLATYPVLNFRTPQNRMIKYWFHVSSKAFPIVDETKIRVEGAYSEVTVQNSTKEVIVGFDKTKMDMSRVTLRFEAGAFMEGAEAEETYTFDFTEALAQDIAIRMDGIDRRYTVRLNVAQALADPKTFGFVDVTADYADPVACPYLSVYRASSVPGVPVLNAGAPETPNWWDAEASGFTEADYMAFIGDWAPDRPTQSIGGTDFTIATIDRKAAKGRIVSNTDLSVAAAEVSGLIVLSGIPCAEGCVLYVDGQVLQNKCDWVTEPYWRSAAGFDAEGKLSIRTGVIIDGRMAQLPFFPEGVGNEVLEYASDWPVVSAASGRPWLVRNGRKLTYLEAMRNDRNYDNGQGEAWNGNERSRTFIGITYDNKIGVATISDGFGTCQGAWVLEKLGWKDVLYLGGSYWMESDYVPTLYIGGKLAAGRADQRAKYCIAIDAKN